MEGTTASPVGYLEGIFAKENSIRNDSLTQTEYNEKTQELYELWDYALNDVWNVLKQTQDTETMNALTAELTKARVYELLKLLGIEGTES